MQSGYDYQNIAGSEQHTDHNDELTNTVTWYWNSPTGDSTDSLSHTYEYVGSTPQQVLGMRKMVHSLSSNPECRMITNR